jgi:hypothetical protein
MAARLAAPSSNHPKPHKDADALIRTVCAVAGSLSFLDEIDEEIRHAGLDPAVASGNTPPIFDWLLTAFSFQGISDRVARSYIEKHGTASWSAMETSLRVCPGTSNGITEFSEHEAD